MEELIVTTQHGVLKSPGIITLPDQSEQAGRVQECEKKKLAENSFTRFQS